MLKKLYKYDLKDGLGKVIIIYSLLSLSAAAFVRIFEPFREKSAFLSFMSGFFVGLTISMMCSLIINVLIRSWVLFGEDFYKDRSYLTHTLPVTKTELYSSKILASATSMILSFIVVMVAIFIAFYSKENLAFLRQFLEKTADMYDTSVVSVIVTALILIFFQMLCLLQAGFIGELFGYKRASSKAGFSILFGAIAYLASQGCMLVGLLMSAAISPKLRVIFTQPQVTDISVIKMVMYIGIALYIVILVVGYFVALKIFKKGVNVE